MLDGLRVIAILMVMLYHFYAHHKGVYEMAFHPPKIFKYGYLGVELFFVISGFVITLTLTKCSNFFEFIKKRIIRLVPGMLVCSVITFIIFNAFDNHNLFLQSKSTANLLLSNTFISPILVNTIFNSNFKYMDGAYWSLWVELQFYVLGGLLYFASPKKFLRNYTLFSIIAVPVSYAFVSAPGSHVFSPLIGKQLYGAIHVFFTIIPLAQLTLWFLAGIIINKLYFGMKSSKLLLLLTGVFIVQMGLLKDPYAIGFTLTVYGVFILFLYRQKYLMFLGNATLSKIGLASYSIYLIHQNIGMLTINKLTPYLGKWNWVVPLFLIVIFTLFAIASYRYLENPVGKKLKGILFKNKAPVKRVGIEPTVSTLP